MALPALFWPFLQIRMRLIWNYQTVSMRTSSMELPLVSICPLPPYNGLIITRMLVLAIPLAVTTLAVARPDFNTAKPIPGYPEFEITDKSFIIQGGDLVWGKRSTLLQRTEEHPGDFDQVQAARACKKAGYSVKGSPTQDRVEPQTPLTKTGDLPVILVPIALLVVGGLLIRKSTAL
jgi:hypothetical protein